MEEVPQKKILIVDDDSFLLDMYALKFSQSGFKVEATLGPFLALDKLRGGLVPDLILSDVIMPDMNGFEFIGHVREEKLAPAAKIIVLSNVDQEADLDRATTLGVSLYIVKASATPKQVVDQVSKFINN